MESYVPISRAFFSSPQEAYVRAGSEFSSSPTAAKPHHVQVTVMGTAVYIPSGFRTDTDFDFAKHGHHHHHHHEAADVRDQEVFPQFEYSQLNDRAARMMMVLDCNEARMMFVVGKCDGGSGTSLQAPHTIMRQAFHESLGVDVDFDDRDYLFSVEEKARKVSGATPGSSADGGLAEEACEIIHVYVRVFSRLPDFLKIFKMADQMDVHRVFSPVQLPLFMDRSGQSYAGLPMYLAGRGGSFATSRSHIVRQLLMLMLVQLRIVSIHKLRALMSAALSVAQTEKQMDEATKQERAKIDEDALQFDRMIQIKGVAKLIGHQPGH
jgi:hypothetical protein